MLELALVTGPQLRAARALIDITQEDLADAARVSIGTVRRMESFSGRIEARVASVDKVRRALEKAGIEFLNHERQGVRLKGN
jgi:predicted transcriptional regulator